MVRLRTELSPHAEQVLYFLQKHFMVNKKHYAPSFREIAKALNTSTSHISFCLDMLQKDGYIEREPLMARTIFLTEIGRNYAKETKIQNA